MRAVKSEDTKPEMTVRRLVHRLGYRYRLHRKELPGTPDLVFSSRKKVIFVNGCFWHGHNCKRGTRIPKENRDYWIEKLSRNVERDKRNYEELARRGWASMVLWECELKDKNNLVKKINDYLGEEAG